MLAEMNCGKQSRTEISGDDLKLQMNCGYTEMNSGKQSRTEISAEMI